jgi:hypothetical protein
VVAVAVSFCRPTAADASAEVRGEMDKCRSLLQTSQAADASVREKLEEHGTAIASLAQSR